MLFKVVCPVVLRGYGVYSGGQDVGTRMAAGERGNSYVRRHHELGVRDIVGRPNSWGSIQTIQIVKDLEGIKSGDLFDSASMYKTRYR